MSRVLSIDDMLSGKKSKYALAVAVAKRAREITDEMHMNGEPIVEKSVNMAIKEFKSHKYEIIEPDNIIEDTLNINEKTSESQNYGHVTDNHERI